MNPRDVPSPEFEGGRLTERHIAPPSAFRLTPFDANVFAPAWSSLTEGFTAWAEGEGAGGTTRETPLGVLVGPWPIEV